MTKLFSQKTKTKCRNCGSFLRIKGGDVKCIFCVYDRELRQSLITSKEQIENAPLPSESLEKGWQ